MARYLQRINDVANSDRQNYNNRSVSGPVYDAVKADWWTEAEAKLFTQWASSYEKYSDSFNNPYFDYFFTGQDVKISIDGLDDVDDELPIYSFGYNIQQQKKPLYGFWSYTYDAVLRGTRIVTGAFSVVHMYPYFFPQKIAKAAKIRAETANGQRSASLYGLRGLDEDEALIDTYWSRHYDSNLETGQQHLFSIHPPFNLIIQFGLQETSLTHSNPSIRAQEIKAKNRLTDPMMTDINERLVKNPIPALDTRLIIENVELLSKQMEYDTEGTPILETYTFMARDERYSERIGYDSTSSVTPISSSADPEITTTSQSSAFPAGGTGGGGRVIRR